MTTEDAVHLVLGQRMQSTVATLTGTLTSDGYSSLRDRVLEVATDAPESVIVDIRDLEIGDGALMTVFSVIARRIGEWPAIPFTVVTGRVDHLARMTAEGVDEFVTIHADVPAAEQGHDHPPRLRALQLLTASPDASAVSRAFVERVCRTWAVPEHIDDALIIVTELVENVLQHTTSAPRLRLELRSDALIITVADEDPRPAVVRERPDYRYGGLGLMLVVRTARRWGCTRSGTGGKVVWVLLTRRRARRDTSVARPPTAN
ncbi:ATP-binding protein [Amycolatopsis sp. NPDC021455]|uniref:ATP-binding protein n=1 Tax=Amycolatopsis sp. NPDC021455 TaxID=3154901 RepID=UPI0033FC5652